MTEDRLPLAELLAKAGDDDFLRSVAEAVDAGSSFVAEAVPELWQRPIAARRTRA